MMVREWVVSLFAVLGALCVGAILGSLLFDVIGFWHQLGMCFGAAWMTVIMACLSAPKYKIIYASSVLLMGAVVAWYLLEPAYLPLSYDALAYQETHQPVIAAYAGGLIAYIGCLLFYRVSGVSARGLDA